MNNPKFYKTVLISFCCTLAFIILCVIISNCYNFTASSKILNQTFANVKAQTLQKNNTQNLSNNIYKSSIKLYSSLPTPNDKKTAYLTFDDGPSPDITPKVLDILSKANVKATFFLVGSCAKEYPSLVKDEFKQGHTVGNHSYSHNYKFLYSDPENLLSDLQKTQDVIKSIVPTYNSKIMRFPGGSFGKSHKLLYSVINKGFHYYDWNCLTQDAVIKHITPQQELNFVKEYTNNRRTLVVLMHDFNGNKAAPEVLPQIISYLKGEGYTFKTLQ